MRIYVGNMSFSTTEETLRDVFEKYGTVESVAVVTDRETGRPRGFGFVDMPEDDEAKKAIDALNETVVDGRTLRVNESRPQERRGGGGGGGGGRFGGGGGGGGRGRGGGGGGRRDW